MQKSALGKIFLFTAFSIIVKIYGQEYIPMDFDHGVWIEETRTGTEYRDIQHFSQGDTLLDGELFYKLFEISVAYSSFDPYPTVSPKTLIGFIKENTFQQVIYKSLDEDNFRIIYDFNLSLGDTIDMPAGPFVVNSIDSMEYCGRYHKRYIHSIESGHHPIVLTEGIGYSNGLLGYDGFSQGVEIYDILKCYMEWGNDQCFKCDFILGDASYENLISIYPNPAKNEIRIHTIKQPTYISLHNLHGLRVFMKENINSKYNTISLLGYEPGIFLVKIGYDDYAFESATIIKSQ